MKKMMTTLFWLLPERSDRESKCHKYSDSVKDSDLNFSEYLVKHYTPIYRGYYHILDFHVVIKLDAKMGDCVKRSGIQQMKYVKYLGEKAP